MEFVSAAVLGLVAGPSPDQLAAARTEGWIAIPTAPLSRLHCWVAGEVAGLDLRG